MNKTEVGFQKKGFERWVRLVFIANALVTPLITFVHFYPAFSETLLLPGAPRGITAPLAMLLLALFFKKRMKADAELYGQEVGFEIRK